MLTFCDAGSSVDSEAELEAKFVEIGEVLCLSMLALAEAWSDDGGARRDGAALGWIFLLGSPFPQEK